jgi:class 3 adenylate cyclase/tetratricopeptide (TPR) repeat protein
MDVVAWLRGLGLEQYEPAFRDNGIDAEVLPNLTAEDLRDIGVAMVGDRRKLLEAIVALRKGAESSPAGGEITEAPAAAPSSEAERRQLTVMFCDLVDSTAIATRLDPEDLRAVIGGYHRCVAAVIERARGFVAKYMGDGVLAYFGYPRADEHDAERAVRSGLALVEAVAGLDNAAGMRLQARVGIATGLVVVGDLIGEGAAQEQAVVGETPNLAARLQGLAKPGAVVIGPSTRRLTGGLFDYEDLGALEIKGLAAPVEVSRVLRESAVESRFTAQHGADLTPLVGRELELATLKRCWRQAKSGAGRIVLISGEPGIGKSRLAQTLVMRLRGEPHASLRLFCSPHHQDSALHPTIAQLQRAAGFRHGDTAEQRLDKLEAMLAPAIDDLGEAAPLLAALLSLPAGARYPPLNLTPQKQKERTLRALVAQVEGLAARQPVLRLFEDAQWSDPTSLELLDLIIDRVPALPVLLIVTFRPEFTPPWAGRRHVTSLVLDRLAPRHRAEMIARITGGKALPEEFADQIVDRTDGVPLFVEELTKAVLESGMLTDAGDRYTAAAPVTPLAIPASVHASLLARLDRLAPVREVAQIGAALGRQFSHELIAAVAPMPSAQLDDALVQLVNAELIYRRGTPPNAEYTFKHALVQDAAYGTLLRSRRRQLHAHIAATLEARFPDIAAAQPALLARHCAEAGLAETAVEHWLAAGRQAWGRSMLAEAVALLRRGLALVPALPDNDWRREREFDLRIALGQALVESQGYTTRDAGEAYARARHLSGSLKRPSALLFARWGQWMYHVCRADLALARQLATEMRELGETRGDVPTRVLGCDASGLTYTQLGDFIPARAYLAEGLALYDPAHRLVYAELLPNDALVQLRVYSSLLSVCLGDLDQAMSHRDAALQEARRLSRPHDLGLALGYAWITSRCVGADAESLCQCATELLALSVANELGFYRAVGLVFRGWSLAALGQAEEGISLLATGLSGMRDAGFILYRPQNLTLLGDACRMAGQWEAALGYFAAAQRLAGETEERWFQAETLRLTGDVRLGIGDTAGAEASYVEALAIARRQSAKLWELRAATSLARLLRDQSKLLEARDLLAPVYGWFTEGCATPVLQDAKALLEELSDIGSPSSGGRAVAGAPIESMRG